MVAWAVPKKGFDYQPTGKISKPVKDKPYLDWIRDLPCIVTGRLNVEAAHISFLAPEYGKLGRGKGAKESDRWAIPLCAEEHRLQHTMNEQDYWASRGINPCVVALALRGAYPNSGLALIVIQNIKLEPVERRGALWPAGNNREE